MGVIVLKQIKTNLRKAGYQMENAVIANVLRDILHKAKAAGYKGIDPYDFAGAPVKLPAALKPKVSFLNKISPFNFRPALGIRASENSKSNALFLHALVNYNQEDNKEEIDLLFNWFLQNRSREFEEFSVGFAFEMTLSRYQSGPGKTSLIISLFTVFAFIAYYRQTRNQAALEAILSFEQLLEQHWLKYETDTELWYSYLPAQKDEVYNATAKTGRFYALLYLLHPDQRYTEKIKKITAYLARVQNPDGSWAYSTKATYVDNFHTAFMLESIYDMNKVCPSERGRQMLEKGLQDYRQNCFRGNRPLHFHKGHRPRDIRSNIFYTEIRDAANAIILFSRLGDLAFARAIIDWTLKHFYNPRKKHFYFFDNKLFKSRIDFIRWQSWMAMALSEYLKRETLNAKSGTLIPDQ